MNILDPGSQTLSSRTSRRRQGTGPTASRRYAEQRASRRQNSRESTGASRPSVLPEWSARRPSKESTPSSSHKEPTRERTRITSSTRWTKTTVDFLVLKTS